MLLKQFYLDQWLARYEFGSPPIAYNLAASTGPSWSLGELVGLGDTMSEALPFTAGIGYAPPEGSLELRRAVAEFHGVDPEWVVVTTGASEALSILFCLAGRAAARIALPEPGFPAFDAVARAWGLTPNPYRLEWKDGFGQSRAQVLGAIDDDTVLALVNTPHNPTGTVMSVKEIEMLARQLRSRGIPLIVDEVYHPLYFAEAQRSAADIDNVIVVSDMSKALSLPGLRIGWLIDSDEERRKRIIDARSYFTISGSPLLERLAVHALDNRSALLDRLSTVANANLLALRAFMRAHADLLSWVPPQGGTVAFPRFNDGRDSRDFCRSVADQGVLLAPGDCFDRPEHFRIGVGAQADGFEEALKIVARVLDDHFRAEAQ